MSDEKNAVNPEKDRMRLNGLRPNLEKRAKILEAVRRYFRELGFLEVETPGRIAAPAPEAHIDAVESGDKYLITSPELHMKRLLGAGYDKIFQIVHCHRSGERGQKHLPEFTMIEWYRANSSIEDLMQDCEEMIQAAAEELQCYPALNYQGQEIYLRPPWPVLKVADMFEKHAGWRPDGNPDPDRFDLDLVDKVEPALPMDRPCFLSDYPASMASLANLYKNNPNFALRFELYAGGLELANGFDELTDARVQRQRFESENAKRRESGKKPYPLDEQFLGALEKGMPPSAGIALGLDRLIMLLTDAKTIDEVVAFPGN